LGRVEIVDYNHPMLYVFHGTNISRSADKARALVGSLCLKRPDASFIEIDADHWSLSAIEENLGGQGLFSSKYIIFLDRVTEKAEAKEALPDLISVMNQSANIFILLEGKLNAELKRAVEKDAEKVVITDEVEKTSSVVPFNIFALGDALASGDRFKAWSLYRQAIESGVGPENVVGTLFWKAKTMVGRSPEKSRRLLKELIIMYHDSHRGMLDLEIGIEKLLLSC
jgi:DNA polymerase III delta subunit